jgi:hypothetical protein
MTPSSQQFERDQRGLIDALVGDGRFLIALTGFCLLLSGGFAVFQSATGHFLPHDIEFLEMTAGELCAINECRIVHFMFHDRVSFGGVLMATGLIYMWLAEFPLKQGNAWAWWTLAASGGVGFASFLSYLGYGYLDSWHGAATLILLPMFVTGMVRAWRCLSLPKGPATLLIPSGPLNAARACLMLAALGITGAGVTITLIGMTTVFVPQDLTYMNLTAEYLRTINPRLIPLIAHDRAGFGGGLCSSGLALIGTIWCATPSRSLWQLLSLVGLAGFSCAIVVHFVIGYTDPMHLTPAIAGAILYATGVALAYRSMVTRCD